MNKRSLLNEHVTNEKNKGGIKRCLVSNDEFNESVKVSFEKKYHSESASGVFENPNEDVEDPNHNNTSFNIYYSKDSKKRKGRDPAPLSKKEKSEDVSQRKNTKDEGNVKDEKEKTDEKRDITKTKGKDKSDYKSYRTGEDKNEKRGVTGKGIVQNEEKDDTRNNSNETSTFENEHSKIVYSEKGLHPEIMENSYDNRRSDNNMKKENEMFYRTCNSNDTYGNNLGESSLVDGYGKVTEHEKVEQKEEKEKEKAKEKEKEKEKGKGKGKTNKIENTKRENEEKERDARIGKEKREEREEDEEEVDEEEQEQDQKDEHGRKEEREEGREDNDCDTYGLEDNKKRKRETEKDHNENNSHLDSEYSFLILKNMPVGVNEEDIKSFMRPFIHDKTPQMQFCNRDVIVKLYDNKLNEYIFSYFSEHPTQIKGSFVEVHLVNSKEESLQHEQYKLLMEQKKCNEKNENLLPLNSTDEALLGQHGKLSEDILEVYGESNLGTDPMDKRHISNSTTECSKVLLVSVINLHFPVDIELLYFLFSKLGVVEKIVNFNRNTIMYQALVQFNTVETATLIFKEFHNKNIYDGCNTILLQYSLLKELVIKANNTTSWDYTVAAVNTSKTMLRPIQQPIHGFLPDPRGRVPIHISKKAVATYMKCCKKEKKKKRQSYEIDRTGNS